MVDPLREAASESDHVRHPDRILSEDVVHLLLRHADQGVGDDDGASAVERVARGFHVFGVGREEECDGRYVLEVALW